MSTNNLQPYSPSDDEVIGFKQRSRPFNGRWGETLAFCRAILADAHAHYEAQVRQLGGLARPAGAYHGWCGSIDDEATLRRAASVMQDVLRDIADWEDRALANAVEEARASVLAMVDCIRMAGELGAQLSGDAARPVAAPRVELTAERALAQIESVFAEDESCPVVAKYEPIGSGMQMLKWAKGMPHDLGDDALIRQRDYLATMAAKDARIAELTAKLAASEARALAAEVDAKRWRWWRMRWYALCRMEVAASVGLDLTRTYVTTAEAMDMVTDAAMDQQQEQKT